MTDSAISSNMEYHYGALESQPTHQNQEQQHEPTCSQESPSTTPTVSPLSITEEDDTSSKSTATTTNHSTHGPSNNYVLGVAFYSFLGFTILQTSYAIKANSSAMVADSSAMFVDVGTYLCNHPSPDYFPKF